MSTASPNPPAPRPAPAQPARAEGPSRHAVWRALFFLLVLVLILITVWHVTDQITKRHAEESFANGQVSLQIARLESRTHLAEAHAHLAAAEAARDSAIATAGIAAAHSLEGSGSKRIQEILAAITDAISQAGTSSPSATP
jgi:F0F1-type ATP synthase membrane subunit b/b'